MLSNGYRCYKCGGKATGLIVNSKTGKVLCFECSASAKKFAEVLNRLIKEE